MGRERRSVGMVALRAVRVVAVVTGALSIIGAVVVAYWFFRWMERRHK